MNFDQDSFIQRKLRFAKHVKFALFVIVPLCMIIGVGGLMIQPVEEWTLSLLPNVICVLIFPTIYLICILRNFQLNFGSLSKSVPYKVRRTAYYLDTAVFYFNTVLIVLASGFLSDEYFKTYSSSQHPLYGYLFLVAVILVVIFIIWFYGAFLVSKGIPTAGQYIMGYRVKPVSAQTPKYALRILLFILPDSFSNLMKGLSDPESYSDIDLYFYKWDAKTNTRAVFVEQV